MSEQLTPLTLPEIKEVLDDLHYEQVNRANDVDLVSTLSGAELLIRWFVTEFLKPTLPQSE